MLLFNELMLFASFPLFAVASIFPFLESLFFKLFFFLSQFNLSSLPFFRHFDIFFLFGFPFLLSFLTLLLLWLLTVLLFFLLRDWID